MGTSSGDLFGKPFSSVNVNQNTNPAGRGRCLTCHNVVKILRGTVPQMSQRQYHQSGRAWYSRKQSR